jgi:hypothetical protein
MCKIIIAYEKNVNREAFGSNLEPEHRQARRIRALLA